MVATPSIDRPASSFPVLSTPQYPQHIDFHDPLLSVPKPNLPELPHVSNSIIACHYENCFVHHGASPKSVSPRMPKQHSYIQKPTPQTALLTIDRLAFVPIATPKLQLYVEQSQEFERSAIGIRPMDRNDRLVLDVTMLQVLGTL